MIIGDGPLPDPEKGENPKAMIDFGDCHIAQGPFLFSDTKNDTFPKDEEWFRNFMNSDIIKSFRVGLSNLLGRESYGIKGLYHHWWLRKKSICGVALHLRRCGVPPKYASLLRFCAPCIWSFLLCHYNFDFLRDHQIWWLRKNSSLPRKRESRENVTV